MFNSKMPKNPDEALEFPFYCHRKLDGGANTDLMYDFALLGKL